MVILPCDWRGCFILTSVGEFVTASICWMLLFLVLNTKIVIECMIFFNGSLLDYSGGVLRVSTEPVVFTLSLLVPGIL